MKDYILLNYNFLFNDHLAECSHQAKLYYIKLMFFANNGFVANPLEVLDSLGFDKGVYYELVSHDELLTLEGRKEVFITSYFIHTKFNPASWLKTPFAPYWKGKLYTKQNGIATLKKPKAMAETGSEPEPTDDQWDRLLDDIETPK